MAAARGGKPQIYFVPDLVKLFGITPHQARITIDRFGIGRKCGRLRVITSADIQSFRAGLAQRGYLRAEPALAG